MLFSKIDSKIWAVLLARTKKKFAFCGENVSIDCPRFLDYKYIEIGNDSHILSEARIVNVSGNDRVKIVIGERTGINYNFTAIAGAPIIIGNDVAIASYVILSSGNHGINPESDQPYGMQPYLGNTIQIKDGAWIGEKACIMQGVTIGMKSIIGGGCCCYS